jgi:hypothetical protein
LAKKWIKFNGFKEIKTKGGIQKIKTYRVVDIWRLNTDFYTPKGVSETVGVSETEHPRGDSNDIQGVSETAPKKNIIKEDIDTKVSSEKFLNSQIKEVMDVFYKKINPTLSWENKTYRKAAADLIKMFGLEDTLEMAETIIANQGPYMPVVTNPWEMKEKLAKFRIQLSNNEKLKSKNFIL